MRWSEDCVQADLVAEGLPIVRRAAGVDDGGLDALCADRREWRKMVHAVGHS